METSAIDDILAEGTTAGTSEEGQEFDHTFDLTDEDLADDDNEAELATVNTDEEVEANDEGEVDNTPTEPTNAAFAQMRTQNKEFQNKLNELDALAKGLGMKDVDDFIAKARDAQTRKTAESQGIPVEVARELEEMRALKNSIVAEREENAARIKEEKFVSNVKEFVDKNKLADSAVDKLSQDLEKDGFSVNTLMDMPKSALTRLLNSYVDTTYQQSLERKNTIRKELPINQTSKLDTESLNKEIDQLARQLAGKI